MNKAVKLIFLFAFITLLMLSSTACGKAQLSTTANPSGGGSVSPSQGFYEKGVAVDVNAIPNPGYRFNHWEGGASGTSPSLHIIMDNGKNLVAYFTKVFTLSRSATPNDGGTISPADETQDEGKSVTLVATASKNYKFNRWAGDVSGNSDHVTVTMDSNKQIVASFTPIIYSLHAQPNPTNAGSVQPNSGTFEAGTQIKITATPAKGYRFDRWGGSATGTSNPLNIVMDNDKNLTAYFTKVYALTITSAPSGIGSVNLGNGSYDEGSTKTLIATTTLFPYRFDHWKGTDNDNENPTTVTMNADTNVTANFVRIPDPPIQTKTGRYDGKDIKFPFDLKAGQWVKGTIHVDRGVNMYVLDPTFASMMSLGYQTDSAFVFQAKETGTYYLEVQGMDYVITSWPYAVSYQIY